MKHGLNEKTVQAIIKVLSLFDEIDEAILYGSRAKGTYKPASDIDIALKGENLAIKVLSKIDWALDDLLLPYTFDLSVYSRINNQDLIDHIQRVGIVLYKKMK